MRRSGLNSILHNCQLAQQVQYWLYTDKGFDSDTHVRAAHHGPGYVSPQQHLYNAIMTPERVSIEWGFGRIKARCPYITRIDLLKLRLVDVAKYIRVAVLLTNADVCMNGSQTSLYFECFPPTLTQYFA
jgi:hypothetical protein